MGSDDFDVTASDHGCSPAAASRSREVEELQQHLRTLIGYARWQIAEGADYHPTLPSAVAAASEVAGSAIESLRSRLQPAAAVERASREDVNPNPSAAPPVQMEAVAEGGSREVIDKLWEILKRNQLGSDRAVVREALCLAINEILRLQHASPVPSSERDDISNDWVKRSERLPSVGGTYLVGAYDDTMSLPRTFVRFWASFFLFDTGPEWQIRDAEHEHRTVEYWIDLPPHPEHPDRKPAGRAERDDIIEREELREKVAAWMLANSFATGHGDSADDLLQELKWQIEELRTGREELRTALKAINELPAECVNSLIHQRQIDADGVEVGVSRQAVDEIHAALVVARAALKEGS